MVRRSILTVLLALTLPAQAVAAPSVTLTKPAAGVVKGTVTLDAAATGATLVRYLLDGTTEIGRDSTCCAWDESWNTTTRSEGAHTVTAVASDATGAMTVSQPVSVTIDNVPDNPPPPPPPPPPPAPIGGCAAGWFPVDAQSWWWQPSFGTNQDTQSRHLHVGGCIPRRDQTLSGTIGFDIVVKMHNNPGTVYYVAIVVKTDSMEKSISVNPGWRCPATDCTFVKHFDINASEFDRSGLEEIRFRASDRQSDLGTELRASVNFQTRIENGKARDDVGRFPFTRAKGWYTNLLYCESDYRDDLTPLPITPSTGPWTPQVRQVDHGAGDSPVTHHEARIDPDIHAGVMGTSVLDGPGQYSGPLSVPAFPAGDHKLMLKTDCAIPTGVNTGVLVVPFAVG